MGVIVLEAVPAGQLFGPIPSSLTIVDPILLIGHMTADNTPDLHTVQIDVNVAAKSHGLKEWIPYVRAARDATEQNLEATLINSTLYYRSTTLIPRGSELFVWYTEELAKVVGVPEPEETTEKNLYICPQCASKFIYPYSLRAHMRFKCEYSTNCVQNSPSSKSSPHQGSVEQQHQAHEENSSTTSPNTSTDGSDIVYRTHSPDVTKRKYPEGDDAINLVKRERLDLDGDQSTVIIGDKHDTVLTEKEDMIAENETLSAFHKVTQPNLSPDSKRIPTMFPPVYGNHPLIRPVIPAGFPTLVNISPLASSFNAFRDVKFVNSQATKENIPRTIRPPVGLALKNREDLRNLMNCGKLPFHPDWRFQYPYIRSQNPIVEQLLSNASAPAHHVTTPQVLQNWCAKCNASFRMTSDLVYHMRSHHKEEIKKVKSKPQEKLRCDVCGDRFKERHHLTRHMTSHQEA